MLPRDERALGCSVGLSSPALTAQGSEEREGGEETEGKTAERNWSSQSHMFIYLLCAVPDPGHKGRGPDDQSPAFRGPGLMTLHLGVRLQSNKDCPGPLPALRDTTPESFSDFILMTFSHV